MSYAIIVTDSHTGNKLELCRVGANPETIAEAARGKTYRLNDRKVRRYSKVEIVEVGDEQH
jgi:metallophosphoesterase superfamily enzyme